MLSTSIMLFLSLCSALTLATSSAQLPLSPKVARSTGCGIPHPAGFNGQDGSLHINSGNHTRHYGIEVPLYYDDITPYSLIFDYHGNGRTFLDQHNNSMYYAYPAGQDYIVVYPQGFNRSWESAPYADPSINDLQFTSDLLAHVLDEYCVDPNHVYASGKSNGGGFVDTLACSDNGDDFAAFAMASAALYTDNSLSSCSKKRAILESHGDADRTIPYGGGSRHGAPLPDIAEWVSWWGQRDCGSGAVPDYVTDLDGFNITCYDCDGLSSVVQHYQVFALGHCWPNGYADNYDALHEPAKQHCAEDTVLDFTPVVLNFFSLWDLGKARKLSADTVSEVLAAR